MIAAPLTEQEEQDVREELNRLLRERARLAFPSMQTGLDPDRDDRRRQRDVIDRGIDRLKRILAAASSSAAATGDDYS